MSGSDFTEGGGKHPPPSALSGPKSPVLLGLRCIHDNWPKSAKNRKLLPDKILLQKDIKVFKMTKASHFSETITISSSFDGKPTKMGQKVTKSWPSTH